MLTAEHTLPTCNVIHHMYNAKGKWEKNHVWITTANALYK